MSVQNQIIYFPYLCFQYSPIKFVGLLLWNFDKEKAKIIQDDALRDYVDKLLKANVFNGRPIQDMAVLSEESPSFKFDPKKVKVAAELRRVLFLCVIAKQNIRQGDNAGHYMATSENFSHVFQNFILGSEFTAVTSGAIVPINDGGYEVGKIQYDKPRYVLQANYRMDEKFFSTLTTLKRKNVRAYRRILAATDSFMSGYFNSYELSDEARILQQARAFEILLQLPEQGPRREFKAKVGLYCLPRDKKFRQKVRYVTERMGKKFIEKEIMAVMWADRFYVLRNKIIHGDVIGVRDFLFKQQAHRDIALWIFLLLVKKIINESFSPKKFHDEILWKNGKFAYDRCDMYEFVQKNWKKYAKGLKKTVNP